jgi:NTP pyrophosphatase (non-canonical NTP hydrolase)|tara:strand:+ start:243 stop:488 length:246 start_codon:yes stop_codon:yes gene_type:complete
MMKKLTQLVVTMEECGELTRACSKVLRHGTEDPKYINNLVEEMGDVMAMIRIIQQTYDIDGGILENRVQKRLTKMRNPDYT